MNAKMLAFTVVKTAHSSALAREHAELQQALDDVAAPVSAAEAQGLLCGMLCAGSAQPAPWIARVLDGTTPRGASARRCLESLDATFQATRRALDDPEMGFQPLLPEDDAPLAERLQALRDWSRGMLAGLALGGMNEERAAAPEAAEFMADLAEFSRLDTATSEAEAPEADFTELLEYARVGTLLLREIRDRDSPGPRPSRPH